MLSQKEALILKLLYENRSVYTTSQEISSKLYISDRTARKYLHIVGAAIGKHDGHIEAKRGKGYRLIIKEQSTFEQFYQGEVNTVSLTKNITSIHESKDRQYYILQSLFFEQKRLFVDNIAKELFVSRSTISNDLVEIKKLLVTYDIELKSKPSIGIYIEGSEQSFRHFIMNYFFMTRLHDNLYTFSMYSHLLKDIDIEEIVIIVLDECREARLQISDFIIFNIVLHIGLSIKRIQSGFEIKEETVVICPEESIEYQTSLRIIDRLAESIDLLFPIEEAAYIAMHLQNKTTSKRVFKWIPYGREQIKQQLIAILNEFDQETGYFVAQDSILIDGLMLHFPSLLLRLRNNTSIGNPLLEKIKERYRRLFDLTVKYFSQMPVFQRFNVTESEWAYLTIHLSAAIERYLNNQKVRALVICATGLGSSQMLRARLEHELGTKIEIERVISYYEIFEYNLENIDIIISSISLPKVIHRTPIIHVSVFLDEADIAAINHELSIYKVKEHLLVEPVKSDSKVASKRIALVKECFRPDLFLRFEAATSKEMVLSSLIETIEVAEGRPIKTALMRQLKLRETYSSVAFSPYLAVPHPIEPVTNSAYVAVAIAPKGINWDPEHLDVQLVFLLSPDVFNRTELEKISMMLVPIIEDDTIRQSLAASTTYEEFIEKFMYQE